LHGVETPSAISTFDIFFFPVIKVTWISSILCGLHRRDQETVVATIEGLAFPNRPSREPG
jgi:hypothetical protein